MGPNNRTRTVLQDVQFAALKEREILMILNNFNSKKSPVGPLFLKNSQKITKLVVLVARNHQNSKKIQFLFPCTVNY